MTFQPISIDLLSQDSREDSLPMDHTIVELSFVLLTVGQE